MKRRLYAIYCVLKRWIAPDVASSQMAYRDFLLRHLAKAPRWLDLGCGHQFLPDWAWTPNAKLLSSLPRMVGVDTDLPSLTRHDFLCHRVVSDIQSLPFPAGSFDLVTANMVMEHVEEPGRVLAEVRRVLAPRGLFLFHTPNGASPLIQLARRTPAQLKTRLIGFFEDRGAEDIYPTVYRINTPREVAELADKADFSVDSCELLNSEAVTQVLGPLAVFELLYIRMTQLKCLALLRPDMIAVLRARSR
jgi:SAM-dependent methyltransferase